MRKLRYFMLSEFGIDYGLRRGRFSALGDDLQESFNDLWWKETCRFEDYLISKFPGDPVFVSDHIPAYRGFGVCIEENPVLDKLCESSVAYLEAVHPDACVVVAHPLGFKLGAGRIVLSLQGVWIDQDIAWWLLKESPKPKIALPGLEGLLENVASADLLVTLPWLRERRATRMGPRAFWEQVYCYRDLLRVGKTDAQEVRGYGVGGEIVSRLGQRYWILDENESCDVYISGSLPTHRIIKVECTPKICDRGFVEGVLRLVSGIDGTWAVRFSVFDNLITDNSYLGGLIALPNGGFIVESGM